VADSESMSLNGIKIANHDVYRDAFLKGQSYCRIPRRSSVDAVVQTIIIENQ
jgi:hypothetical protein